MGGELVSPPVSIGGIGGSGTRLIAEILRQLGYYMGDDLNKASDNLWFTLLFKRTELRVGERMQEDFDRAVDVFRTVMFGDTKLTPEQVAIVQGLAVANRPQHVAAWLRRRAESLLRTVQRERKSSRWGWKEPNTHVFLDRLHGAFPNMRYIHVMRNGLDMAYSSNQSQLRLWGPYFFGGKDYEVNPRWSLKYWSLVHRRIVRLGEELRPGRFMLLNYDAFCAAPREGLPALLRFLGVTADASLQASLMASVRPPGSIGRFRQNGLQPFDPEDVACVRSFGFDAIATKR